jgi:release factor glutamine methyltransferase
LSHALGQEKSFLYAHPEYELGPAEGQTWRTYVAERCAGRPTQYITGVQEFYGLEFRVTPDVLIPRPETELLVEETLARAQPGMRIVDVGTGSGCVAVSVARNAPGTKVLAGDVSRAALAVARENSRKLTAKIDYFQGDLLEAARPGSFDIVVCNPPYVPLAHLSGLQRELRFEPAAALFGGENGLEIYGRLVPSAAGVLRRGGWLLLELGYNCRAAVEALFNPSVWRPPEVKADLAGIDRVLAARKQ